MNNIKNNSPNFGMKYKSPRKWNIELLDTVMNSKLVKQIDHKYPNPIVSQKKIVKGDGISIGVHFKLDKNTEHTIYSNIVKRGKNRTYQESYQNVGDKINKLSIEEFESEINKIKLKKEHDKYLSQQI